MNSFEQALSQAASERDLPVEGGGRWRPVLEAFVGWLNQHYEDQLRADIHAGAAPGTLAVRVGPTLRRSDRFTVLPFYLTDQAARVLVDGGPTLSSEEDLQRYLVSFVRLPAFKRSVEELEAIGGATYGFLRPTSNERERQPLTDIVVLVSEAEQRRLADACETEPGKRLKLVVSLNGPTVQGQGEYAPYEKELSLVSGGYVLRLERHAELTGNDIEVEGIAQRPA